MNVSDRIEAAIAKADAATEKDRRDEGYRTAAARDDAFGLVAVEHLRITISRIMAAQFEELKT
jgi:hypothetical protein